MKKLKSGRGFSLIELIMSMVILGVIMAIGVSLVIEGSQIWIFQSQRKEMSESARVAMDRMVREMRRIQNSTSVVVANSNTFQFVDSDSPSRNITFDLSGTSLRRTETGSTNILADNVSALSFTYYDASGAVIATPTVSPSATNIRRIEISLTFSLGDTQFVFSSQAALRRLL